MNRPLPHIGAGDGVGRPEGAHKPGLVTLGGDHISCSGTVKRNKEQT